MRLRNRIVECASRFGDCSGVAWLNKLRPAPVPVGSKVRLTATPTDVEEITDGYQLTASTVSERVGGEKSVCLNERSVAAHAVGALAVTDGSDQACGDETGIKTSPLQPPASAERWTL
jgi:hypothetical protein